MQHEKAETHRLPHIIIWVLPKGEGSNMEIWKDIQGYEGIYQVSNLGRVKSIERVTKEGNHRSEKQMKLQKTKRGYLTVILTKDGNQKLHYVHRLVGIAFIPNPTGKEQINHINEQKEDNRVENLEWSTAKENMNWGTAIDRRSKKLRKPVICIELGMLFDGLPEAEKQTGAKRSNICKCLKGIRETAGGYHWKYK